jgi:hypothetical protein
MNTAAIATIAAELAKLTPQEHSIAIALAQRLRVSDKPSPLVETPRRASNRCVRWSDEDTKKVKEFLEDSTIMSDRSKRQAKRALCRELGRTEDGIKQKIFQLQSMATQ